MKKINRQFVKKKMERNQINRSERTELARHSSKEPFSVRVDKSQSEFQKARL